MSNVVITGAGVVSPFGFGKERFRDGLQKGRDSISEITSFSTEKFKVHRAGEIKDFDAKEILGKKGLRNLSRTTLFLLAAAKGALDESSFTIDDKTTDSVGVCTGTTFSHLDSIIDFDREVLKDGLNYANPALFPSTVINAASSHVSIRFNIQGFNTTISTGYTSSLDALKYSIEALQSGKSAHVLCAGVEALTPALFFGFHQLEYMAGIQGPALSCPFDRRRNGPLFGEGAAVFFMENLSTARQRNVSVYARILSTVSFFDGYRIGKIHPRGQGLSSAVRQALDESGIDKNEIDYISSCANSSPDLDRIETAVLKDIFGKQLKKIPLSSIKSMIGETCSASGALQIASCLGAMQSGYIPPTINYEQKDPECDVDCVPNKAQKKDVKKALVLSSGPGGYNSACLLERYEER